MIDRQKLMFVMMKLADVTSRKKPDGKGFNRWDYEQFHRDWMPGGILGCSQERVREWALRVSKYRRQIDAMGMEFPACILAGE